MLLVEHGVSGVQKQLYGRAEHLRNAGRNPLRCARLVLLACLLSCVPLGNAVGADDASPGVFVTTVNDSTVDIPTTSESGAAAAVLTEQPARFTFEWDNDFFAGTDRDYTGATHFAWSPAFSTAGGERSLFTLSQDAWTPDDKGALRPPDGEHPYAGWLYLSAARATTVDKGSWSRYATIGVIGPSSRAEAVQRFLHKVSGTNAVKGWDSERSDRAALQLGLRRDVSVLRHRIWRGGKLDFGLHGGAAIGSVMGYLHTGGSLRIGRGTTRTVGPFDTAPGEPDFAAAFAPASARYLHIGLDVRAVGWDETLNADTSRAPSVDLVPLVAELRGGVVASFGNWRFAYTYAVGTRTYRTGSPSHAFGSLNIARVWGSE